MTINEQFKEYGVVPVVVLNDAKDALPLAKALVEGGLACAEVTFRTDAAEESIRLMSEAYPEMLVGARYRSDNRSGKPCCLRQVLSSSLVQDLIQRSLTTV